MDSEPRLTRKDEVEERYDTDIAMVLQLLSELPHVDTSKLTELQIELAGADNESERFNQLLRQYALHYSDTIDKAAGPLADDTIEPRAKIHLTLMLHESLILRATGDQAGYITGLTTAAQQARSIDLFLIGSGIEDVIAHLQGNTTT